MQKVLDILYWHAIKMVPCPKVGINRLVERFGKFPATYMQFLQTMGFSAGVYMRGSSVFYKEIEDWEDGAIELLEDNDNKLELPASAFVFWMHQGYQFAFFNLDDGDDPRVYYYTEVKADDGFVLTHQKLSDFYLDRIRDSGLEIPQMYAQ